MPLSVLVVGGENLCRSPLGAVLLDQALARAGVAAQVASAGLRAIPGHPVDTFTDLVAQRHGVDLSHHRARLLTQPMLQTAGLILTMDPALRQQVQDCAPHLSDRIRLFDHWSGARGIHDPRHRSIEFHQAVHLALAEAARVLAARLS